jgi:hypothetical protein
MLAGSSRARRGRLEPAGGHTASPKEREDGLSDVVELHRAIRRRRLLMTAGVFRGLVEPITAEELLDQAESKPCPICGTPWETVTAVWEEAASHYVVRLRPSRERGQPTTAGSTDVTGPSAIGRGFDGF